jgi:putrescine transport system substrate-binding protein
MRSLAITFWAFALGVAALASSALGEPRIVNILSWSDYFDSKILEDFTQETGVGIVYDAYTSSDELEARLRGKTDYDVVVATGASLQRLIASGVLQKLDKTKLPNSPNLWAELMARLALYDPGNQYAIPYLWFTTGIAYDVDKAKARLAQSAADSGLVTSWDTILRPDIFRTFADCGIYVLDSPEDLFAIALRYLHLNPDSKSPNDLRRAAEILAGMRRYVKTFSSSDYGNALANGDICLAVGWTGGSFQAKARAHEAENGVDIDYAIPKEGTLISLDTLAMPKQAPHVADGYAFIDFLLRPEIAARNSNATKFANGVPASKPWIAKDILDDKAIYPDPEVMSRLFAVPNADAATQKLIAREWIRIKTGKYP